MSINAVSFFSAIVPHESKLNSLTFSQKLVFGAEWLVSSGNEVYRLQKAGIVVIKEKASNSIYHTILKVVIFLTIVPIFFAFLIKAVTRFGKEFEVISFEQKAKQPKITFDLQKVQQVYDNYKVNRHAGLTLVIGHPFGDEKFRRQIQQEQNVIKDVFASYGLEDLLTLYNVDSQVHATLIELASQHDNARTDQQFLDENELLISNKTKNRMDINYSVRWIKKTAPFEIELGPAVLSNEHSEQTLRITDSGQIVMKGRAKDRKLLAKIRTEFEKEAGVIHKYGKDDDEFFFVIGYLKPDFRLNDPQFCRELEKCINIRRPNIQLALKVDGVKFIMYQNYSLDPRACLWESKECKLLKEPVLPQKNLTDSIIEIIRRKSFEHQKREVSFLQLSA